MSKHSGLLIDGQWHNTGRTIDVVEKYSGLQMGTVSRARVAHVRDAIGAATEAFDKAQLTGKDRYKLLSRAADALQDVQDEAATLLAHEVGKPMKEAQVEVERSRQALLLSAEEAKRIQGNALSIQGASGTPSRLAFTLRVPVGVVAIITPFNSPLATLCHKVGPALAAGNTVVIKPATATPLSAVLLCRLLHEAGFPAGYVNLIVGHGRRIGRHLLRDPRIAHYNFTGSVAVGEEITRAIGLRRCTLDLGGPATAIVSADADLQLAAAACVRGAFVNAGQGAVALQHILVDERVRAEFESRLVERTKELVVGDPTDPQTDVSAMISLQDADRVDVWVDEARKEGARVLSGAQRRGAVYHPTILSRVPEDVRIMREEVAGPVVVLESFSCLDEAYTHINESGQSVQASLFTGSLETALRASELLKVNAVVVNEAVAYGTDATPVERLHSGSRGTVSEALKEMMRQKRVEINMET